MPWSREQRSRLITAVKEHEILWRTSQNNRNHQHLMREALEVVHRQFESDGFTFDEVKQQWRNLKDIFYKRYEVSLKRAQSGEQPSRVRPCWAHFDELKFLLTNQQWVDPESKGRHRRCLAYNSIEFTDKNENYEYSINSNEEKDLLKIKEEINNNLEGCSIFVESAVRDLHQESPELARRLMQSIYSSVSSHQMEATNKEYLK
uniref:MADF domain-containing protein n=1 Tax=Meloidogyne hapla TaxID=6305 RepID=A0A1I8BAT7_MELHA